MVIGDGTAPQGFPLYTATTLASGERGVMCTFRNCKHKGTIGPPAKMECDQSCACPCCQCLQGKVVHGVRIG